MVRSSSAHLPLSSRISRADSVGTPGACPASTSDWRTHVRTVSAPVPSRAEMTLMAAHSDS
jgi:hypothetical protein